MVARLVKLKKDQTFQFTCSPKVACFNACCRDLNQVLAPYDVLRLKQYLEMTSTDFLNAYTRKSTGPGTGLPVVSLHFGDTRDLACPFVTPAGCRVYPARPASCRTYPLARGVSRDRKTGRLTEQYALVQEPHCKGFESGRSQTAVQWVDDQQIDLYNFMNDRMLELISRKNHFRPGVLPPSEEKIVYTALYDLDAFYEKMKADLPAVAQTDELERLFFAMDWVCRHILAKRSSETNQSLEKATQ
jgi:hypothetical protein